MDVEVIVKHKQQYIIKENGKKTVNVLEQAHIVNTSHFVTVTKTKHSKMEDKKYSVA